MSSPAPSRSGLFIAGLAFAVHLVIAIAARPEHLMWDEPRYLEYAANLSKGFYVTDENPAFVNGPGYPLVLLPFVAAGAPLVLARALNAVFIGLAAWLVWAAVRHYAGGRWAAAAALFTVFHPSLARMTPFLMTEPLAVLCLSAFIFFFCKALRSPVMSWPLCLAAAFSLGWLTLTRVLFGHVTMAAAVAVAVLFVIAKSLRPALGRSLIILAAAFAMCIPYLAYTQAKTGKPLAWSTNGSELLYWMTSHNPGENGHWFSHDDVMTRPELRPHVEFYRSIQNLGILEKEEAFNEQVSEHFKSAPAKVAFNWLCNVCRFFLGFPRAFQHEELLTLALVVVNGLLLLGMAMAAGVFLAKPSSLPVELWVLAAMALIYTGGSTVASALPRYFLLTVPIWVLIVAVAFQRRVAISIRP